MKSIFQAKLSKGIRCHCVYFVGATYDNMVSPKSVDYFAKMWGGGYNEIEGPHVLTYSPALEKVIKLITDKIYKKLIENKI